jgi:hypothetical protein
MFQEKFWLRHETWSLNWDTQITCKLDEWTFLSSSGAFVPRRRKWCKYVCVCVCVCVCVSEKVGSDHYLSRGIWSLFVRTGAFFPIPEYTNGNSAFCGVVISRANSRDSSRFLGPSRLVAIFLSLYHFGTKPPRNDAIKQPFSQAPKSFKMGLFSSMRDTWKEE